MQNIFHRLTAGSFIICILMIAGIIAYHYDIDRQLFFVADIESSRPGVSQIFYDIGHGYNERDSSVNLLLNKKSNRYAFPLSSQYIGSIRFDPINLPAVVRLKDARIENRRGEVVKTLPPESFRPIQQIRTIYANHNTLVIHTADDANDPITQIDKSSIHHLVTFDDYMVKRGWAVIVFGFLTFLFIAAFLYFIKTITGNQYIAGKMKALVEKKEIFPAALAVSFSILIVIRWWYYIDAYSVNILFWDQWDFFAPLFNGTNLCEIFVLQHGPHRMGIGLIIAKFVATLSGWNTRAEAFVIGGIVCLAMFAAFYLKIKLEQRLHWTDAAIPLIFLTPMQYEIFAGTPFLSYGAMLLLLLVLYCIMWVSWRGLAGFMGILILNVLLIFNGYGVFVGGITPCLFGLDVMKAHRRHDGRHLRIAITGLAVSLLSAGIFFINYQFQPGIAGFHFPVKAWWEYPQFVALMLANFFGIKGLTPLSYWAGFLTLLLMIYLALSRSVRLWPYSDHQKNRSGSVDMAVALLTAYTLIFCINTAIGRLPLGLMSAQSSRYVTHIIPGFFGIYLWLSSLSSSVMRRNLLLAFIAGLIVASFPLRASDRNNLRWYSEGKTAWKAVYLQTENIDEAMKASTFTIYPFPERTNLKQKLEYLKKRKLNLYLNARENVASAK